MGKGTYLGGSTVVRGWGGHVTRSQINIARIDLNAHLNKPKNQKQASKKGKPPKRSGAEKDAEVRARRTAEEAKASLVVETRRNGKLVARRVGLNEKDVS